MSDPLVPNYKKDVGRLATDRFDFQDHVEGVAFRHKADAIDVFPTIVIGSDPGVLVTTVQEAIVALNDVVSPPEIQDATLVTKGILKLAGDIGGVADNVIVTRIQTHPISTLPPSDGDVLTWDGGSSVWIPSPATNAFSAAGDLAGNNVLQQVIGLTGTSGIVSASCSIINFLLNSNPLLTQATRSSGGGLDFTIRAQSTSGLLLNGGDVIISGGRSGAGGREGGIKLQMTSALPVGYPNPATGVTAINMLEVVEVVSGRRVLSLCNTADLTSIDMPSNTGDMVIYVRDTATPPAAGNPSNGTIVYSSGGQLWVKQQDGNQFSVGTIPNPSIWGNSGQQTYTSRNYVTSTTSANTAFSFNLPDQTATRVDVIFIGKKVAGADSAQFNLSMGYVRHGGGPVAVGSVTNADPRNTAGASGWTIPTITVVGNTLQVKTGFSGSTNINWLVITQLTMSQG